MQDRNFETPTYSRRGALKAIGAVGLASGAVVPTASAAPSDNEDYYLGECVFTEVKLEYSDVASDLFSTGFGLLGYIIDRKRGRIIVNDGPADVGENEVVVTNSESYVGERESLRTQVVRRGLTKATDYRRHRRRIVPIDGTVAGPEISVARNGAAVDIHVRDRTVSVAAGDERTVRLEPEEYVVRTANHSSSDGRQSGSVESHAQRVTPSVSIRNHGIVSIHGAEGRRLLPLGIEDGYARARSLAHRDLAPKRVTDHANGLLAVDDPADPETGTGRTQTNNGGSI